MILRPRKRRRKNQLLKVRSLLHHQVSPNQRMTKSQVAEVQHQVAVAANQVQVLTKALANQDPRRALHMAGILRRRPVQRAHPKVKMTRPPPKKKRNEKNKKELRKKPN